MAAATWSLPPLQTDMDGAPHSAPVDSRGGRNQGVNPQSIFSPGANGGGASGYISDVPLAPTGRGDTPDESSSSSCSDTPPTFSEEPAGDSQMEFPFAPFGSGAQEPVLMCGYVDLVSSLTGAD
jgi:hypothetical protein